MLNPNQINKLMKKAEREVQEKERKCKQEQDKQLLFIMNKIIEIKNENPKRGPCFCLWEKLMYEVTDNKISRASLNEEDIKEVPLELVRIIGDTWFYMFSQAAFEETTKIMNWMSDRYAEIKIALAKLKPSSDFKGKDQLFEMFKLGSIVQDFLKAFPGKNLFYFKACIAALDERMKKEFQKEIIL